MATINELMARFEEQKARKAKAQGTRESIEARWRDELGTDDPEKVREIIDEAGKELDRLKAEQDRALQEAEAAILEAEAIK